MSKNHQNLWDASEYYSLASHKIWMPLNIIPWLHYLDICYLVLGTCFVLKLRSDA